MNFASSSGVPPADSAPRAASLSRTSFCLSAWLAAALRFSIAPGGVLWLLARSRRRARGGHPGAPGSHIVIGKALFGDRWDVREQGGALARRHRERLHPPAPDVARGDALAGGLVRIGFVPSAPPE